MVTVTETTTEVPAASVILISDAPCETSDTDTDEPEIVAVATAVLVELTVYGATPPLTVTELLVPAGPVIEAGETDIVPTCTVAVTLNVAPAASVIKIVAVPAFGSPRSVTVDPEIDALTVPVSYTHLTLPTNREV